MRTDRFRFEGSGGVVLDARLDLPDGAPRAAALFAHCFTCGKDSVAASRLGRALAARGIATLRFDFTGLGGSDGEFGNAGFSGDTADIIAAARHLGDVLAPARLLVGHSLGGAAVLAAAGALPDVKAVVTIGAPADPAHVTHNFAASIPAIEAGGEAEVQLAGRRFTIRRSFLDDIRGQPQLARIRALKRALLVLHAPGDASVGIENAQAIFAAALHPKSFVSLDRADHLLTDAADALYVADLIAAWSSRYIEAAPGPA